MLRDALIMGAGGVGFLGGMLLAAGAWLPAALAFGVAFLACLMGDAGNPRGAR